MRMMDLAGASKGALTVELGDQPYREDIPEFVRRLRDVLVGLGDPAGGLGELERFLRGTCG